MARSEAGSTQNSRRTFLISLALLGVVVLVLLGWWLSSSSDDDPASTPATTGSVSHTPTISDIMNAPLAVPASCANLHSEVFAETHDDTMNVAFSDGQSRPTNVFDAGVMEIAAASITTVDDEPAIGVVVRCHGPYGPVDAFAVYDAHLRFQHALEPYWDETMDVLGGTNPEYFTMSDADFSGSDITFVARGLVPAHRPEVGGVGKADVHYVYDPANAQRPFRLVEFDITYPGVN